MISQACDVCCVGLIVGGVFHEVLGFRFCLARLFLCLEARFGGFPGSLGLHGVGIIYFPGFVAIGDLVVFGGV